MLVAHSTSMKKILTLAERVSQVNATVLLRGEPGVGRQTLARYIHSKSAMSGGPFVAVNLALFAIAEAENMLFGHQIGALPSKSGRSRAGNIPLLRSAHGGTLLLQNVEEMPLSLQPLFVKFIQEGEFVPFGARRAVRVNVRVIATTSHHLEEFVKQGRFRADLYYRLNVILIDIPPLRERHDDILPLARHFISLALPDIRKDLSVRAIERLVEYPWPGNVQQLRNVITRACLLSSGPTIDDADLSLDPLRPRNASEQIISELKARLTFAERRLKTMSAVTIVASPIWQGKRISTEADLCFVLMPFADIQDVQKVYQEHVKPTVEKCGMRCIRADDIYDVSGVMQSIWEAMNRSRVIIAEMTNRNPNVFYELGIAHTLGKPVVMITQSMGDIPFDLKHLRCIEYKYKPRAIERFQDTLVRTLTTVLETPVTDVDA